jgi:transcriptional regulator with XRE-family HTH domain
MYYQKTMDFSEWLSKKLDEKGWSRVEAAKRGGISASMYDKVIRDHQQPGRKFIEAVAKAFKMEVADVWQLAANPSARISEQINQQAIEIIESFELEETKRRALDQLQKLKRDEETKRKSNGTAVQKRSPKPKSS